MKHLRQLLRVSPSIAGDILLAELRERSLIDLWVLAALQFWNRVRALPVDDMCHLILHDSLREATATTGPSSTGFAAGICAICRAAGYTLAPGLPDTLPHLDSAYIMEQRRVLRERQLLLHMHSDPRTCPSTGAAWCKYWRWFHRSSHDDAAVAGKGVYSLSVSPRKLTLLLRFRVGCCTLLPSVAGRHRTPPTPRAARYCTRCGIPGALGDERHLVFECTALHAVRTQFSDLFAGVTTMRHFMNQAHQKRVLDFITACLDYDRHIANGA